MENRKETGSKRKGRFPAVLEMLRMETTSHCPATLKEIQAWLEKHGYEHGDDAVYNDLRALIAKGEAAESAKRRGHAKTYYYCGSDEHAFDIGTLKLLMDAVEASSLPDARKTEELQRKIAALAGKEKGEALLNNQPYFNSQKHSNPSVTDTLAAIELALERQKKVSFVYYDWSVDRKEVPHRGGYRYVVDPICTMDFDGRLYLWCFTPTDTKPHTYRVDRMRDAAISEEDQTETARDKKGDAIDYYRRTFSMYEGKSELVTLQFEPELAGAMVDRFGEQIPFIKTKDGKGMLSAEVGISPTFFGWIDQFGGRVKITAPAEVRQEYLAYLRSLLQANEEE